MTIENNNHTGRSLNYKNKELIKQNNTNDLHSLDIVYTTIYTKPTRRDIDGNCKNI